MLRFVCLFSYLICCGVNASAESKATFISKKKAQFIENCGDEDYLKKYGLELSSGQSCDDLYKEYHEKSKHLLGQSDNVPSSSADLYSKYFLMLFFKENRKKIDLEKMRKDIEESRQLIEEYKKKKAKKQKSDEGVKAFYEEMQIMSLEPRAPENKFYGAVLNVEYGKFVRQFQSVGRRKSGIYEGAKAEIEKFISYKSQIERGGYVSLQGPGHLSKFGVDKWEVTPFCVLWENEVEFPSKYRFGCTRLVKRDCMLNDRVTFTGNGFGVGLRERKPQSVSCKKQNEERLKAIKERMEKKSKQQ